MKGNQISTDQEDFEATYQRLKLMLSVDFMLVAEKKRWKAANLNKNEEEESGINIGLSFYDNNNKCETMAQRTERTIAVI